MAELAETRAIARALGFGGIGVDYTGAEEACHVAAAEAEGKQSRSKEPEKAFPEVKGDSKPEAPPPVNGTGKATQA